MATALKQFHQDIVSIRIKLGELEKMANDNTVVAGKAKADEIDDLWGDLQTAIQACSQTEGDDFFELT